MVYNSKLIVVVKSKGKILRDTDGVVRLPFGSDYHLTIKNKNTKTAVVSVEIDGEDVLDSSQLVVKPNETFELKGFLTNSTVRNKFRFTKKTDAIVNHRGDRLDDGIIRVEYQFEKPWHNIDYWYSGYDFHNCNIGSNSSLKSSPSNYRGATGDVAGKPFGATLCSTNVNFCSSDIGADEGITVKGAQTRQSFTTTTVGTLEQEKHVIILQLRGKTSRGKKITKPVTTRKKIMCVTCGKNHSSHLKFCSGCGTCLL